MGRKKSYPHRSGGIILDTHDPSGAELGEQKVIEAGKEEKSSSTAIDQPFFVEVDRSGWLENEHLDICEIILTDLNFGEGFSGFVFSEEFFKDSEYTLRFRLSNVNEFLDRIKLGHWPVLTYTDISLELVKTNLEDHVKIYPVLLSGFFDGPDKGISGLIHLTSLKFFTLRPILGIEVSVETSSLRMRVQILKSAFDACDSLLENSRQIWKKSMMNLMSWVRPEVMTSEVRYGISRSIDMEVDSQTRSTNYICGRSYARFDVASFYEAIKPSKTDPMIEDNIPGLLPEMRPYQRRAAYWMLQQEKAEPLCLGEKDRNRFYSPLCVPVDFLDTCSKMFFNPFSGNVSLVPEPSPPHTLGGILADEMGLGKTVELLACIFAHKKPETKSAIASYDKHQVNREITNKLSRLKRERVECICGAVSESINYRGLWVQCDVCDAWQHADCVGYTAKGKSLKSKQVCESRKYKNTIALREGEYVCQICSELIQATESPVLSGATLIVCPAPILPQWHGEIIRHTHPGTLKTCIYEGVRETSFSNTYLVDISELASADIVLTTYDVLKEDLSHDSDRFEGDRRFMRFQKRYPVIPTLLTRILWWRVCLDEAQMVESNAAAATEMATRLYAKHLWCITGTPIQRKLDDLYGLLRFLKVSPFNVFRWWTDVIRYPYERGDQGAMEFTHKLFKQIMWRSSKVHVADELHLPPQDECISWLTLSPVEEHFYQRQHETCVSYAHEVIERLRNHILKRGVEGVLSADTLITHSEAGKLLNTLLKLRQACCHPQVGSSGLRSLQQSPMSMDEVLMVLLGKTKIEGEEALRRLVVAINGLAAIAIIEKNFLQAVVLYKEALAFAEEHSEDFRLDPLLNIHIHHNLAEIIPQVTKYPEWLSNGIQVLENSEIKACMIHCNNEYSPSAKRQKMDNSSSLDFKVTSEASSDSTSILLKGKELTHEPSKSACSLCVQCLRATCETSVQKYLSAYQSKLSVAQQDFQKIYLQVCNSFSDRTAEHMDWWLEALHYADQNKDFCHDLMRKIEEAIAGSSNTSKSSRITARFRSINALKYHVQMGLDQLEASRKLVLDRLIDIDRTMEKPNKEDIERAGNCRNCQGIHDGPDCIMCELDGLFQKYEARLFHLQTEDGGIITSAEEAVDLQKKESALNRFYWNLSKTNKKLIPVDDFEESKKRGIKEKVVVKKLASQLEVILGVIKSHCKTQLGREGVTAANKLLSIFEGMRKEYPPARSLSMAQAQYLQAHDEIKMAISRKYLRENENDKSSYALDENELPIHSTDCSHDKFICLTLLMQIKGKLRYLKGLVQSKHKTTIDSPETFSLTEETTTMSNCAEEKSGCIPKVEETTSCPVCQEKLGNEKMVFQCGHVTCCKCLVAMTEHRLHENKFQDKWVMCPTCRQHTDVKNIAYAVDEQNGNSAVLNITEGCEKSEAFVVVKGSYGTKIEAITRRILWIKSTDAKAKVLVFSSWNDVLDVLEHAFCTNNISYVRMKGGRKAHIAINEFRGQSKSTEVSKKTQSPESASEPIQVLLLLIQHGANGLNLLEAKHVVLVEPLLNPAAEAQAISRVHRIGQGNKTLVHRFLVKNSVEESIHKLNRSRSGSGNLFVSGNTKNQDQPVLTLKDVESLFAMPSKVPEIDEKPETSLRDLPPSVAASIAAQRRLDEQTT